MVLLVVDTQKLITNGNLYEFDMFVSNVKTLIGEARENGVEVAFVRHDDGADSQLTKGKTGFEIYEEFKPMDGERIFDKTVNSAFRGTGLLEYLKEKGEREVIVVGLQTDYCIDATVKCGFEHGFDILVPKHANTTVDNGFMSSRQTYEYYNEFIWNKRYAKCLSVEDAVETIRRK